uniref:C6 domain-containing protein n=1 Tax=Panagrolaimus davidi TaxID=227884 RepID=A0A914PYL5_9BILA
MVSFVLMVVLLSVASQQIVDGCMPTPNTDDNVIFPIPTTTTPRVPVSCERCTTPLKFEDFCGNLNVVPCSTGNVINVNCGLNCAVQTRNGDVGPFIPIMMQSADFMCDDSGDFYFGTPNNVVTTIRCG